MSKTPDLEYVAQLEKAVLEAECVMADWEPEIDSFRIHLDSRRCWQVTLYALVTDF